MKSRELVMIIFLLWDKPTVSTKFIDRYCRKNQSKDFPGTSYIENARQSLVNAYTKKYIIRYVLEIQNFASFSNLDGYLWW